MSNDNSQVTFFLLERNCHITLKALLMLLERAKSKNLGN